MAGPEVLRTPIRGDRFAHFRTMADDRFEAREPRTLRFAGHSLAVLLGSFALALSQGGHGFLHAGPLPEPVATLIDAVEFPKGWEFHAADKGVRLSDTWRVVQDGDEPVLVCAGNPPGYLRTVDAYDDFELSVEWKYAKDPNCNSGLLIYTGGADRIWPRSVQVQLHRPLAGSIFPIGGARTDGRATVKDLKLAVGEWQKCIVTCRAGTISVVINGKKVSEVAGCDPKKGHIALQSEGSEIHFRRMTLRRLK